jgi:periplasmic protein TonB
MFEDSLVESSGRLARRKPWTTLVSLAAQIMVAGMLVLLSLIYTEALPNQKLMSLLEAPAPPPAAAATSRAATRAIKVTSEFDHGALMLPREIPKTIVDVDDGPMSNVPAGSATGVFNGAPGGIYSSAFSDLLRHAPVSVPKVATQKVRVSSGVAQGLLILQVKPEYPALARQARVEGTVVLQATIGKDGTVQNLRLVSGHPMLTQAAIQAVKQWMYKPYYLNGEPVEVDTQINVKFTLSGE